VYQLADISLVNIKLGPRKHIENYAIICSGYSGRHIYHTAKLLAKEVKALECP
jgi:ribosomal silencing factor RsfS